MNGLNEILRLYAVTDRTWTGQKTLFEQVEEAIRGGVTCVQLREKNLDCDSFLKSAIEMKRLCEKYNVPLIINDNVEIALLCGADGVHVGQNDMSVKEIRKRAGQRLIIGVTAKTVEAAQQAEADGADYLGSGAVFGSTTKLNTKPMTKEQLREICKAVSIPVVAIGGIHRQNALSLARIGIAGLAVVSGIFSVEDIETESRKLRCIADKIVGV